MLKLILLIIIVQTISNDARPFPENMYHGKKLTISHNFLRTQGLQTTPIERYKQVCKRYSSTELMAHKCNERQISNVYWSKKYGKVGFSGKTYTEKYYPKGKYFPDIDSYDKECLCPIFRTETWNPETKWNMLYSGEYLNDSTVVEALKPTVLLKLQYNMELEYNNITHKYSNIPVMWDAFMFTSKLLTYYYENYQWIRWNFKISHYNKQKTTTKSYESVPPCYLNPTLRNKLVFIPPFKLEEQ